MSTSNQINIGLWLCTTCKDWDGQTPSSWWESHSSFSPLSASQGLFILAVSATPDVISDCRKKCQVLSTASNSLWTTEPGWFGSLLGSRLPEQGFSPREMKLCKSLILLLFSFSRVNFMPVESARLAGQENEGLYLPLRKVRKKNNLAHKGHFCPSLSRRLREKQANN